MKKQSHLVVLPLVGALIALCSCDPLMVGDESVVKGVIVDAAGAPIEGVAVTVNGVSAEALTDSAGRYAVRSPYELGEQVSITALRPGFVSREMMVPQTSLVRSSPGASGTAKPLMLQPTPPPALLDVLSPTQGAVIDLGPCCNTDIEVRGIVSAPPRDNLYLDVAIAIDLSGSIAAKKAFADEIGAARSLVQKLDPTTSRVTLIGFASDAAISLPLTGDRQAVLSALDAMETAGPTTLGEEGAATHFAAAIRAATGELKSGVKTFQSSDTGKMKTVEPRKIAVLLTDGIPTLPSRPGTEQDKADIEATLAAARNAAAQGVEIHGFAFAIDYADQPLTTLPAIAAITSGKYYVVDNPGDVAIALPQASFVGMGSVVVTNTATGQSVSVLAAPDGFFSTTINVQEGPQAIEVQSFDESGTFSTSALVDVTGQTNLNSGVPIALEESSVASAGLWSPLGKELTGGGLYKLLKAEFPDAVASSAGTLFVVNGSPSKEVKVTGELVYSDACYKSDIGFLVLMEGQDIATAFAAAKNKNVLINSGRFVNCSPYVLQPLAARFVLDVPAGGSVVFFMVPNSTLAKAQAGAVQALFTDPSSNPGGYAQTMVFHSAAGRRGVGGSSSIVAFEDIAVVTQRSDQDFDDLVLYVDDLVPSQPECGCE